jgi:hypothetical protein
MVVAALAVLLRDALPPVATSPRGASGWWVAR